MNTRQRAGGAVLAVVGALGVTASAYLNWFNNADATDIPLERLFQTNISDQASSYWNSMALPLAVVSVLGVIGGLLLSRFILSVGWLVGVAALVLWIVMQANDDSDPLRFGDLQAGPWVCAAALLVMILGIAAMGPARTGPDIVVVGDTGADRVEYVDRTDATAADADMPEGTRGRTDADFR